MVSAVTHILVVETFFGKATNLSLLPISHVTNEIRDMMRRSRCFPSSDLVPYLYNDEDPSDFVLDSDSLILLQDTTIPRGVVIDREVFVYNITKARCQLNDRVGSDRDYDRCD